jgi:hypothetical protein
MTTLTPEQLDRLLQVGITAKEGFQSELVAKGNNASGRLSASLVTELLQKGVQVITNDAKYWRFVNAGFRPAGGRPPVDDIFQWSIDKGIPFATDNERRSFSYAVSVNIGKGLYMANRQDAKGFRNDFLKTPEFIQLERSTISQIGREIITSRIKRTFG